MYICDFYGEYEVADRATLDERLATRSPEGRNDFFLIGAVDYPRLAIAINGTAANVHYFPEDGHPGFLSIGSGGSGDLASFQISLLGETIQVPGYAIVPVERATAAAHEFMINPGRRPQCLDWFEL